MKTLPSREELFEEFTKVKEELGHSRGAIPVLAQKYGVSPSAVRQKLEMNPHYFGKKPSFMATWAKEWDKACEDLLKNRFFYELVKIDNSPKVIPASEVPKGFIY